MTTPCEQALWVMTRTHETPMQIFMSNVLLTNRVNVLLDVPHYFALHPDLKDFISPCHCAHLQIRFGRPFAPSHTSVAFFDNTRSHNVSKMVRKSGKLYADSGCFTAVTRVCATALFFVSDADTSSTVPYAGASFTSKPLRTYVSQFDIYELKMRSTQHYSNLPVIYRRPKRTLPDSNKAATWKLEDSNKLLFTVRLHLSPKWHLTISKNTATHMSKKTVNDQRTGQLLFSLKGQ